MKYSLDTFPDILSVKYVEMEEDEQTVYEIIIDDMHAWKVGLEAELRAMLKEQENALAYYDPMYLIPLLKELLGEVDTTDTEI